MYNRLPEDELACLKHVEDIKHRIISLEEVCFAGLYCTIILKCMVEKNKIYCMMLHLMYANISSIHFYALYLMTYIYEAQSIL